MVVRRRCELLVKLCKAAGLRRVANPTNGKPPPPRKLSLHVPRDICEKYSITQLCRAQRRLSNEQPGIDAHLSAQQQLKRALKQLVVRRLPG